MEISWNFVSPKKWEPCLSSQQSRTRLQNVQLTYSANPDFDLDPANCKTQGTEST